MLLAALVLLGTPNEKIGFGFASFCDVKLCLGNDGNVVPVLIVATSLVTVSLELSAAVVARRGFCADLFEIGWLNIVFGAPNVKTGVGLATVLSTLLVICRSLDVAELSLFGILKGKFCLVS